jgi:hypothetical protein
MAPPRSSTCRRHQLGSQPCDSLGGFPYALRRPAPAKARRIGRLVVISNGSARSSLERRATPPVSALGRSEGLQCVHRALVLLVNVVLTGAGTRYVRERVIREANRAPPVIAQLPRQGCAMRDPSFLVQREFALPVKLGLVGCPNIRDCLKLRNDDPRRDPAFVMVLAPSAPDLDYPRDETADDDAEQTEDRLSHDCHGTPDIRRVVDPRQDPPTEVIRRFGRGISGRCVIQFCGLKPPVSAWTITLPSDLIINNRRAIGSKCRGGRSSGLRSGRR